MRLKVIDLNSPDNVSATPPESIRLQVYMAHAGVASRRASERLIQEGHVTVNGALVTDMGIRIQKTDVVCVDGNRIQPEAVKRYVLLHKPSGYVCSLSDEQGRPTAADILKNAYSERLYNIGRLDMYSSGALIFTNDGQFAAVIGHPSANIEKEYIVEASLPFGDAVIKAFSAGIRIEGSFYKCKHIERLSARRMKIILVEGKNREIRKVLDNFDVHVKNLVRVRIGAVSLVDLKPGDFRELSEKEIADLLSAAKART